MTIKELSQLFMWGFEGTEVVSALKKTLKKYPPAGVILFKRNLETPHQIKTLTSGLERESQNPLLIGIDEEGGRVSRLPQPLGRFPAASILGDFFRKEKDSEFIRKLGRYRGHELRELGINLNFAPVLDVNSNPKNPIIGDRAFSNDPKQVAQVACLFFEGMQKEGVLACGKHFPGHGDTHQDSHLTLPTVRKSRRALEKTELVPFREAVRKKIPLLMTAHVVYPALDPDRPATLSSIILKDILRKQMKFEGVIISDDLEMKAVSEKYSLVESSLLAMEAGVDLILICQNGEKAGDVVEEVFREVNRNPALEKLARQSRVRVQKLLKKLPKVGS